MIRLVLDTNVLISALLQPLGPSAKVLLLTLSGWVQFCLSVGIYAEYEAVIRRPRFGFSEKLIVETLRDIHEKGIWVRPTEPVSACSDADDNMFLECAQAASAKYLITGNTKHFPATWLGTRIVTPREFLHLRSATN